MSSGLDDSRIGVCAMFVMLRHTPNPLGQPCKLGDKAERSGTYWPPGVVAPSFEGDAAPDPEPDPEPLFLPRLREPRLNSGLRGLEGALEVGEAMGDVMVTKIVMVASSRVVCPPSSFYCSETDT